LVRSACGSAEFENKVFDEQVAVGYGGDNLGVDFGAPELKLGLVAQFEEVEQFRW
jgi:hypothetical protein